MKTLNDFLVECPGIAGDIARALNSTLISNQPGIALAAALSFVGMLKCRRVVSPDGIYPNVFTLAISPSGTGKTQAQKFIRKIITAAQLTPYLMGEPGSSAGICTALEKQPRRVILWEEFGPALDELTKTQTGPRALILRELTNIFSRSNDTYTPRELATKELPVIHDPCLSVFAVSTEETVMDSLADNEVKNGFLPRWLTFYPDEKLKRKLPVPVTESLIEPFIEPLRKIEDWYHPSEGALGQVIGIDKRVLGITFIKSGIDTLARDAYYDQAFASNSSIEQAFINRAYEHYVKVSLIVTDGATIETERYFAAELVEHLIRQQINRCAGSLGLNKKERDQKRFADLIQPGETKTKGQITKAASDLKLRLSRAEREALIQDLIDTGDWEDLGECDITDSGRRSKCYSRRRHQEH